MECSSHGFGCLPVSRICLIINPENNAPTKIPKPKRSDSKEVTKAIIIAPENKLVVDLFDSKNLMICGKIMNLRRNNKIIKINILINFFDNPV